MPADPKQPEAAGDGEWRIVQRGDVTLYRCGLRAGQHVRLRKDLVLTQAGKPTGEVTPAGERWRVLVGSTRDTGVIFFMTPTKMCTWDDDVASIGEWFEIEEEPVS